ncbi:MAG: hypothetical protein IT292_04450 [Deltaproteobacteria bacterium]|nr:hypothetical protein [Deltaproteobacteria bacterium]
MTERELIKGNIDERKFRFRMNMLVVIGVLVLAFSFGLISGYQKQARALHMAGDELLLEDLAEPGIFMPKGLLTSRIGNQTTINTQDARVLSFFTKRPVKEIIDDQTAIWKAQQIETYGIVSPTRGTVVGKDKSGNRYSVVVWQIPPTLKKGELKDFFCQGIFTSFNAAALKSSSSYNNELEIPVRENARGGVVFSSQDLVGKSLTTTYINPGDLKDNQLFYRQALQQQGWILVGQQDFRENDIEMTRDEFSKDNTTITVLITENSLLKQSQLTSTVNVTKLFNSL